MEIGHAALLRLTRRARDVTPAYRRCAIKTSKETVSQLTAPILAFFDELRVFGFVADRRLHPAGGH